MAINFLLNLITLGRLADYVLDYGENRLWCDPGESKKIQLVGSNLFILVVKKYLKTCCA
ncbi:MAG: hypothetical protein ACK52J_01250 [bacterium]|jgi:ribosomal protein L19E